MADATGAGEVVAEDTAGEILIDIQVGAADFDEGHDEGGGDEREKRNEFGDQNGAGGVGGRVVNEARGVEEVSDDFAEEVVERGEKKDGPSGAQAVRADEE